MKYLVLTFCLFVASFSEAVPAARLLSAIEKDLNGLFSETINEGESYAEVLKLNGKPQIKCSQVIQKNQRKLIFCTAQIRTEYLSGGEEQEGFAECSSLGFLLDSKNQIKDRYNEDSFRVCLEKVYDASYD